jgi:hypothetical protein
MAYMFAVKGYSKTDGKEILHVEPFWWNKKELRDDPRLKEIDEDGFLDYEAKLSADELRELRERYAPLANEKHYQDDLSQRMIRERIEQIDWAVKEEADKFSHFTFGFYEWDSGM